MLHAAHHEHQGAGHDDGGALAEDSPVHGTQAILPVHEGADPWPEKNGRQRPGDAVDGDVEQGARESAGKEEHQAELGAADGPGGEKLDEIDIPHNGPREAESRGARCHY